MALTYPVVGDNGEVDGTYDGVGAGMHGNVLTNGNLATGNVAAYTPNTASGSSAAAPSNGTASQAANPVIQPGSAAPTNPNGSAISTNTSGLASGMLSPSQIAASAPATQQQFGGVSTVNPDTYSAADVNASYIPGALQASEDLNAQALAPQFQQQDMSLDDNLASRGIVDSGAATYLNQNLAGNQSAALASADAPLISQYAGYNQADQLSNQSAQNTAAEYNATAGNAAAVQNADAYNAMNQGNTNAYNSWLDTIEGQGSNYGNTLEQNFAGTYGNLDSTALNSLNPNSTISAYENGLNNSGSGFGNAFSAGLSALTNQSNNGQGTQSSPTITAAPDDDVNNYLGYYG